MYNIVYVAIVIFVVMQEWLSAVKCELPLATISRLIKHLGPQVQSIDLLIDFTMCAIVGMK